MSFKPFGVLNAFISTKNEAFQNLTADSINKCLESLPFKRVSGNVRHYSGWVPPHFDMQVLGAVSEGNILMALKTEEKKINTSELKELLDAEIAKFKKENNVEKVPKDEKSQIKTKLENELLKTAQSKFSTTLGWLCISEKRLILNTGNMKQAERFIDLLERTIQLTDNEFNGFEFAPLQVATDIPLKMTAWVEDTNTMPDQLELMSECVIREPQRDGRKQGKISYSAQTLEGDRNLEIYLGEKNYSVVNLALSYSNEEEEVNARMSIDESFMIKKFKLGSCFKEILKGNEYDTELQQFDTEFNAFTKYTNTVLNGVIECFGGLAKNEEISSQD
ncbi:recombination-associated protein RdgC [Vibrio parahaemolyticus]|uniref:recombination-associated protein RdgC n=1 Tax=Vibrio parahaemolyticus TaxID=670 RepID=UPI00226A2922|nr:recombination-associated protein RdgC [Vibrio parahaemolyticus]MCX8796292.1 recombination-associated protein RdgC [Vibrio parahaemolyticus]